MPVLDKKDVAKESTAPGMERWSLVDGTKGSESITVAEVVLAPGAKTPVHYHPTEEAMIILEGELEAILGDDRFNVSVGQIVVAPGPVAVGRFDQEPELLWVVRDLVPVCDRYLGTRP